MNNSEMSATRQSNRKVRRYTHRVVRVSDGADCGEHTSRELAEKRRNRLIAMSHGWMTTADFRIDEIETQP